MTTQKWRVFAFNRDVLGHVFARTKIGAAAEAFSRWGIRYAYMTKVPTPKPRRKK